ncbi:hypothetical protein D5086_002647 [Populus alba]|uniref:Uncharacterized protein n=1 Tax=Populus alba TaxID=43335 RepID=A0ACC4D232_POPAL
MNRPAEISWVLNFSSLLFFKSFKLRLATSTTGLLAVPFNVALSISKWESRYQAFIGPRTVLFQSEARHLNGLKVASSSKNMEFSFTRLVLRGIKQSGPSQGGPGHRSGNAQLLGQPANSGPSPGVGHKYSVLVKLDAGFFHFVAEVNSFYLSACTRLPFQHQKMTRQARASQQVDVLHAALGFNRLSMKFR